MKLASGDRLAGYAIIQPLDAGGMGELHQARDTHLSRDVAIKLVRDDIAGDPVRIERLRREALHLASVTNPHIAVIHGFEDYNGTKFLVMELVPGLTLADRLAKGPLPMAQTLAIAGQIAEALEAAHDRGIVHCDLKPSNIKVSHDGHAKVLDFGLARAITTDGADGGLPPLTTISRIDLDSGAAVVVGTPAYMSPEQA